MKLINVLLKAFAAFLIVISVEAAPNLAVTSGENTLALDRTELEAFPQTRIVTTSPYFEGTAEFTGPSLRRVLEFFSLEKESRVVFRALNDYEVDGNIQELLEMDAIIATRMDGKPMSVRDRGPFWIILPLSDRPELDDQAFHRFMIWQLEGITLN